VQFTTPDYGIRAGMVLLRNYYLNDGLDTIRQIIGRWAPVSENDTGAYVDDVATRTNMGADIVIDPTLQYTSIALVTAIVMHENGIPPAGYPGNWYSPDTYLAAYALAFPQKPGA
jgi:hypothetical protein